MPVSSSGTVGHLYGAIQRFEDFDRERLRIICIEIAILIEHGIETDDSTTKRQRLHAFPNELFSFDQLICMLYVAAKKSGEVVKMPLDLDQEYYHALELVRLGR